jgi:hypothetical protein
MFWCYMHNVQVGTQMAKLATLQLVQPVGVKFTTGGPITKRLGPHPFQVFPTQC